MDVAEFLDARLDAMLAHPLNWGGAEAFELQVLLLLELRQFLRRPSAPAPSLRTHLDAYSSFLRGRWPDLGPRPLSAISDDVEVIAQGLDEFRATQDRSGSTTLSGPAPSAPEQLGTDVAVTPDTSTKPRVAA